MKLVPFCSKNLTKFKPNWRIDVMLKISQKIGVQTFLTIKFSSASNPTDTVDKHKPGSLNDQTDTIKTSSLI